MPSFFVRLYVVPYALFRGNRRLGKKKPGERVCVVFLAFSLAVKVIKGETEE